MGRIIHKSKRHLEKAPARTIDSLYGGNNRDAPGLPARARPTLHRTSGGPRARPVQSLLLAAGASMKVTLIPVTPFQQNCSLVVCEKTGRAAVVDPGGDLERIEEEIARQNVQLEKVLLTHGHIDHCGGAKALATRYGVPIVGPQEDERFWIEQLPTQSQRFGFPAAETFEPDHWLNDGDTVQVGDETLEVYHCPGHTPGHVVFFSRAHRVAIVGDVLFAGSIGRTDFPRGNHADLVRSIKEKLWPLGDDVTFVPGHGPVSTFGDERRTNPFVSDKVFG